MRRHNVTESTTWSPSVGGIAGLVLNRVRILSFFTSALKTFLVRQACDILRLCFIPIFVRIIVILIFVFVNSLFNFTFNIVSVVFVV